MTYFDTGVLDEHAGFGESYTFDNFLWQMRMRNIYVEKHEVIQWLKSNGPHSIMAIGAFAVPVTVIDSEAKMSGIHPAVDGLTHSDFIRTLIEDNLSPTDKSAIMQILYSNPAIGSPKRKVVGQRQVKQWLVKMTDRVAVVFKLHFPDAQPVDPSALWG